VRVEPRAPRAQIGIERLLLRRPPAVGDAGRDVRPRRHRIFVAALQRPEQRGERDEIETVMLEDARQILRPPEAQPIEPRLRRLRPAQVPYPLEAEKSILGRAQAAVRPAMHEGAPRRMEQIDVGKRREGVGYRREAVARGEQGMVEGAAVVRHQGIVRLDDTRSVREHRRLACHGGEQELCDLEPARRESRHPQHERHRAGAAGEPRGLGVEEDGAARGASGGEQLERLAVSLVAQDVPAVRGAMGNAAANDDATLGEDRAIELLGERPVVESHRPGGGIASCGTQPAQLLAQGAERTPPTRFPRLLRACLGRASRLPAQLAEPRTQSRHQSARVCGARSRRTDWASDLGETPPLSSEPRMGPMHAGQPRWHSHASTRCVAPAITRSRRS